jgi:hypothetical protein
MKRLIMSVIVLGLASPITSVVAQEREIGRYQIVMNPVLAQSTFLLDTVSGQVWQLTKFGALEGEPLAWAPMSRLDSSEDYQKFVSAYAKKDQPIVSGTGQRP